MQKLILFLFSCLALNIAQAQPPTITSFSPASGPVGTLVTINGTNLSNPTSITIGGVAALPISNTGTKLVVMVMPNTVSGTVSLSTTGGNTSGTAIFSIVASVPPSVQQGSKLVGSGNVGAAYQGASVSLSADGNTAIVGGHYDSSTYGSVWIYIRNNGVWSQQAKLRGTGNTNAARQGFSVGISADGNTAIVGGHWDNYLQGAAWVFVRTGSSWVQQGNKLVGTGNIGAAQQGAAVSISADGNTVIVGGYYDDGISTGSQGAAWIYTRSGNVWSQQGSKLTGLDNFYEAFGWSVNLSADGNTAIIGGYENNSSQGAAWIFTRNEGVWSQQGSKLVGNGFAGHANQGYSVSISADGNTAIMGGLDDNAYQGAAWVFKRVGGAWSQQGNKLIGSGIIGMARQGNSVSLSADGNAAIIGGYVDNSGQGASWIFNRNGDTWTQQGNKIVCTENIGAAYQGSSVGISADGKTIIVGGYFDNNKQGAAWIFSNSSSVPTTITSFKALPKNTSIQVEWQV